MSAPLTVGVAVVGDEVGDGVGAAAQVQSVPRRREGSLQYPDRTGPAERPSEVAAYCMGAVIRTDNRVQYLLLGHMRYTAGRELLWSTL